MVVIVNARQHQSTLAPRRDKHTPCYTFCRSTIVSHLADNMKANLPTLLLATQLLFIAYVISLARGLANRTTLILAMELLFFAETLGRGLDSTVWRIICALAPRARRTLSTTVADVVALIATLHFIRLFLEQLLRESPAPGDTAVKASIPAATAISCPLLEALWGLLGIAISVLASLVCLRWISAADFQRAYVRHEKSWVTLAALIDVSFCLLAVLHSHTVLHGILAAVLPSANIGQGALDDPDVLEHLEWLFKQQLGLGWALEAIAFLDVSFRVFETLVHNEVNVAE